MDPCGTPQWIGAGGEVNDPIFTEKVLPFKYEANHSKALNPNNTLKSFQKNILVNSIKCGT